MFLDNIIRHAHTLARTHAHTRYIVHHFFTYLFLDNIIRHAHTHARTHAHTHTHTSKKPLPGYQLSLTTEEKT